MKVSFKQIGNIPNLLSLLRIVLIPVFIVLYIRKRSVEATLVLAVSGLTDCVDGFVARHFNQITDLGKVLDPLADKLTQASVAVMLTLQYRQMASLLAVFVIKELLMLLGGFLVLKKGNRPPGAQWWGKLATIIFYAVMTIIVASGSGILGINLSESAIATLISIAAVFMIFSFLNYLPLFFKYHKEGKEKDS